MEWIFFGVGVAVIGVIGVAVGLALGRAFERRSARGEGIESDSFMTPVGPATAEEEDVAAVGGDDTLSSSVATDDALDGGEHD